MTESIHNLDACEIADLVRAGELKATEVLDVCLERIGRFDTAINAFVLIDAEGAREQAEVIDLKVAGGEDPGPLAGVPVGVKDLEDARGLPTRHGSLLSSQANANADSTQVARLRASGAVIVGKTTTPELGSAFYTSSKLSGTTRNPWNPELTPGGSSGGSAAAVSAGLVPLATGSDGGGSIRIPSSYCGLPGLKVTYGLIPQGPNSMDSGNLATHGPIARSVRDIARYLDQVVGDDPMDPFSIPHTGVRFEESLNVRLDGLTAVWSSSLGFGTCDAEVEDLARSAALRFFETAKVEQVTADVNLPNLASAWAIPAASDCYVELKEFWPSRQDEMTGIVMLAMMLTDSLKPEQYAEATQLRYEALRHVNHAFEDADFIVTPTTPTAAFDAEGPIPLEINGQFVDNPLIGICFTYPFNLTGHPAISIPAGVTSEGLPVGLQIVGPRLSEARLLSAARLMEIDSPWPKLAPGYA